MTRSDRPSQGQEQPEPGCADVHIVAAGPEAARQVVETLRRAFSTTEHAPRPGGFAGPEEEFTRIRLTVDTVRGPASSERFRPWLVTGGGSHPAGVSTSSQSTEGEGAEEDVQGPHSLGKDSPQRVEPGESSD